MDKETGTQCSKQLPFEGAFHLHPQDALTCLRSVHQHLQTFTQSFKERIEIEIQYSKSLIRVSKHLSKHINPSKPSPLSYFSSAFQVEHEQRARHALQLAQYLHSQIEIPCQTLLQESGAVLKQLEKQLRFLYKQGENTEEIYQKHLKKYFRSRQDWEEKLMNKIMSSQLPGISVAQLEKLRAKLNEEKDNNTEYEHRYLDALSAFNKFANHYNKHIEGILLNIQQTCLKELSLESDSLRKLIVSEVNMFKNIQYDLLNISRQMESLSPPEQLHQFAQDSGPIFNSPIISIYSEGPLVGNFIDLKYPMSATLLEHTLLNIDSGCFGWILDNKFNSTLRFCLKQVWKQFQGQQTEQFMEQLQQCISHNKIVENMPLDNTSRQLLNKEDVFSLAFSIVSNIATFLRPISLDPLKETEILQKLRNNLTTHHFYRFIASITIQEFLQLREEAQLSNTESERLVLLLRLIIEESLQGKDIFVLRSVIGIMFEARTSYPLYLHKGLKDFDCWHLSDFWEAVIFEGAFEEISLLPSVTKSELKQIYLMRQKNIMFSALATYCHYMAMMGCEASQVQSLASRFIHIYALYEQHRKDLSKMIRTSIEKYNQLNSQSTQRKDPCNNEAQEALAFSEQKTEPEAQQNSSIIEVGWTKTESLEQRSEEVRKDQFQQGRPSVDYQPQQGHKASVGLNTEPEAKEPPITQQQQ